METGFSTTHLRYDHGCMFRRLFPKKEAAATGISILLLQRKIERFSDARLNEAMERAWQRKYDPQSFFALSIFDGDGAVLKFNKFFVTMQHFDRRLEQKELGNRVIPDWAAHNSYSSIEYKCPGGVPEGDLRDQMYSFLGLLCAQLCSLETTALFFLEERIFIPNTAIVRDRLASAQLLNPYKLANELKLPLD